jgi:uncharacterized protein (DUF1330 family)
MKKALLLLIAGIFVGVGATQLLHAAQEPTAVTVTEVQVKDVEAYKEWLPGVQKTIAEAGGRYVAGGFNKTTAFMGDPPPNRVVIITYPNLDAFRKWWASNGEPELKKAEKFATFRIYSVEGVKQK